jgi:hypothetical protein
MGRAIRGISLTGLVGGWSDVWILDKGRGTRQQTRMLSSASDDLHGNPVCERWPGKGAGL